MKSNSSNNNQWERSGKMVGKFSHQFLFPSFLSELCKCKTGIRSAKGCPAEEKLKNLFFVTISFILAMFFVVMVAFSLRVFCQFL